MRYVSLCRVYLTTVVAIGRMIGVRALVFGGLATLLAGVGLYGVLAYTTVQLCLTVAVLPDAGLAISEFPPRLHLRPEEASSA